MGVALLYAANGTLSLKLLATAAPASPIPSDRLCADEAAGLVVEKRPVPDAFLAAAGARQRAGACQRRPFGPGRQGLLLHSGAIVVNDFRTVASTRPPLS